MIDTHVVCVCEDVARLKMGKNNGNFFSIKTERNICDTCNKLPCDPRNIWLPPGYIDTLCNRHSCMLLLLWTLPCLCIPLHIFSIPSNAACDHTLSTLQMWLYHWCPELSCALVLLIMIYICNVMIHTHHIDTYKTNPSALWMKGYQKSGNFSHAYSVGT